MQFASFLIDKINRKFILFLLLTFIFSIANVNVQENNRIYISENICYANAFAFASEIGLTATGITEGLETLAPAVIGGAEVVALGVGAMALVYAGKKLYDWLKSKSLITQDNKVDINTKKVVDALPLPEPDAVKEKAKLSSDVKVADVQPVPVADADFRLDDVIPNVEAKIDEAIKSGELTIPEVKEAVAVPDFPKFSESDKEEMIDVFANPLIKAAEALKERTKEIDNQTMKLLDGSMLAKFIQPVQNLKLSSDSSYPKWEYTFPIPTITLNNGIISFAMSDKTFTIVIDTQQYATYIAIIRTIILAMSTYFAIAIVLSRG